MINPTGKKLEKIIFKLFDDASQGVDRYNHNGSLWAILTNENKWVVEFTKDQTLWYNYNFFKDEMELIGLDCVEDKDLIQKWFESRFLNINSVEDTIQNGVKHTLDIEHGNHLKVEDTIQNGVKDISSVLYKELLSVEDTIENGVKHTEEGLRPDDYDVEDTIQNGVKHTNAAYTLSILDVEDTIQNGVKNTYSDKIPHEYDWSDEFTEEIEDTIQNGVKLTKSTIMSQDSKIENTIQNGVKETHDDCSNNIARVEGIVRIGEKLN